MHIAAVLANQEQVITSAEVLEIIIIKSVHTALTPEEGRPLGCTPPERNKHYSDKTEVGLLAQKSMDTKALDFKLK